MTKMFLSLAGPCLDQYKCIVEHSGIGLFCSHLLLMSEISDKYNLINPIAKCTMYKTVPSTIVR